MDILRTLADTSSVWNRTPKRVVLPDWAGHIPFQFLLFSLFRPSSYVELGVFHGDSYLAACQAVKEFGLSTTCTGIDSWLGDAHTGNYSPIVLQELRKHHDPNYGTFSTLERGWFSEKLSLFPDHQIDLLHIDGAHDYDRVKWDFDSWLPKVSKSGIILLHDTHVTGMPEFGVWRLWEQLRSTYDTFSFSHCHGLGVLSVGPSSQLPAPIRWLFDLPPEQARAVDQLFAVLGDLYVRRAFMQTTQTCASHPYGHTS